MSPFWCHGEVGKLIYSKKGTSQCLHPNPMANKVTERTIVWRCCNPWVPETQIPASLAASRMATCLLRLLPIAHHLAGPPPGCNVRQHELTATGRGRGRGLQGIYMAPFSASIVVAAPLSFLRGHLEGPPRGIPGHQVPPKRASRCLAAHVRYGHGAPWLMSIEEP